MVAPSIYPPQETSRSRRHPVADRKSNQLLFRLKADFKTGDEDVHLIWNLLHEDLILLSNKRSKEQSWQRESW
jgi:hypothetical protein